MEEKKKVLILGKNSYIGTSFRQYIEEWYPNQYEIDSVTLRDDKWKGDTWSVYDSIINVSGKAHISKENCVRQQEQEYYHVNYQLACDTAAKAVQEGVRQYIYFSSMSVYGLGDSEKIVAITSKTKPAPENIYGDSKWKAEQQLQRIVGNEERTNLVILRPPMIYGKGCRGNYQTLAKIAKHVLIFPDYDNERSMLYIGNLCEFLVEILKHEGGGVYFPQDAEYIRTSEMVRLIGKEHNRKIILISALNPFVCVGKKMPGKIGRMVRKAFGSLVYDKCINIMIPDEYQKYPLDKSIKETESDSLQARG